MVIPNHGLGCGPEARFAQYGCARGAAGTGVTCTGGVDSCHGGRAVLQSLVYNAEEILSDVVATNIL